MKYSLFLLAFCCILASCQKELSLENPGHPEPLPTDPTVPAEPVKETRKYQLRAFYSDIPIDFIEGDDEIRSETDLWRYVKDYLTDDVYEFTVDSTEVMVHQHAKKIAGNNEASFSKTYYIGTDSEGSYMKFLGPEYEQLRYRLQ
jgi:hypothetical protein